jgi:hypothetical protein
MKISINVNTLTTDEGKLMPGVVKTILQLSHQGNELCLVVSNKESTSVLLQAIIKLKVAIEAVVDQHPKDADIIIDRNMLGGFPGWFQTLDIIHHNNRADDISD